jgi:hypothetical protein
MAPMFQNCRTACTWLGKTADCPTIRCQRGPGNVKTGLTLRRLDLVAHHDAMRPAQGATYRTAGG